MSIWYFQPVTNHYQFAGSDPGAPWIIQTPLLHITSPSTFSAKTTGGTAITLKGIGFGDGATVKFGGTSATSVVVVDSNTITCVTPAHVFGPVSILVTNTDAGIDTRTDSFTYITPPVELQWRLERFNLKPRMESTA